MGESFSILWGVFVHPVTTLTQAAASLPAATAVVVLVAFGMLWGLMLQSERWMHGLRKRSEPPPLYLPILVLPLIVLAAWSVLAAATLALAHLVAAPANFERLFSLLALASLPKFFSTLTFPLRSLHWFAYRAWQGFALIILCWMTVLVGIGLSLGGHLIWWKALIVALPMLGLLYSAGIGELLDLPDTFIAAYRWRKTEGERVVVFTPRDKSAGEIAEIVQNCDTTLMEVERQLQVEPLKFKVFVFLFPDKALYSKLTGVKESHAHGLAHGDCISTVYDFWWNLRCTIVHELCHVLREQHLSKDLVGLLDEGLARYMEAKVTPTNRPSPSYTMPTSLHMLALSYVFFDWYYTEEPEYAPWDYYTHAHAFVDYLIERNGMEKFKQLCREAGKKDKAKDKTTEKQHAGERLAKATKMIYGLTLKQMEQEWRGAMELYRMLGPRTKE